ncbi:MAG: hypothetical protein Q9187_007693, partial [Circinaria calcarea]
MSLLGLPNEVLCHIWTEVFSGDVENFALCCKHIYQLSAPYVAEDKRHRKKYRTVRPLPPHQFDAIFVGLFQAITLNRRAACYPSNLVLQIPDWIGRWGQSHYTSEFGPYAEAVYAAVDRCAYLTLGQKSEWKYAVSQLTSAPDALLSLVLATYPNIRSLDLATGVPSGIYIRKMLDNIASINTPENTGSSVLHKLTKVRVERRGAPRPSLSHSRNDLALLASLAALPSVKSLRGKIEQDGGFRSWPYQIPRTGIVDLTLHGYIESKWLATLLASMCRLRRFNYAPQVWWTDGSCFPWEPRCVIDSLHRSTETLEYLQLNADKEHYKPEGNYFVGHLHAFKVLNDIRMDLELFVDGERSAEATN